MQSLDIVELIEKNPLTRLSKNYQTVFLNKIKESFTESQQNWFVSSFYCYLNYNSKSDFVIDLNDVWKWLGYSRKDHCKTVIDKHFTQDIDYKIVLPQLRENLNEPNLGGRPKETILLSINTFKKLCLKSNTKKADEIHDYFIKLEEVYHEIVDEETNELRNQIQQNETQSILDKQNILLQSYHKVSVVYLIKVQENLYKFGETDNIKRRFNEHRREIHQDIRLVYCIKSKNNSLLEQKLKDYLRCGNHRKEQIINSRVQTELIEIDDIKIIEDQLVKLNNSLIDDQQTILELKAEVLELKKELELYKTGQIQDKVFSYDTYKNFFESNLEHSPNSKIELKVVLDKLEDYVKINNLKFLQKNMYSTSCLNGYHGYSPECKNEVIESLKKTFDVSYKDNSVKRHFVGICLKDSTTYFNNQVYKDFVNSFIEIGNQEKDCKNAYKYKVRTNAVLEKFNNYIIDNNIKPLFKINKNDSLFNKELIKTMCLLTNCRIGCVKHNGIDYQSFVGINLL
jgi:phage anti-repressor protein/predicted GIY-YIG superfamily endonuclease